jgi:hypothetical protein
LRADLHVHSDHSGLKQLRFMKMRDCYSPPVEVYRRAKARGMDLVTLTDHDTIDGCLEIRDRLGDPADFFMSEEVETFLPGQRSMHIGVFGIDERQHRESSVFAATSRASSPISRRSGFRRRSTTSSGAIARGSTWPSTWRRSCAGSICSRRGTARSLPATAS